MSFQSNSDPKTNNVITANTNVISISNDNNRMTMFLSYENMRALAKHLNEVANEQDKVFNSLTDNAKDYIHDYCLKNKTNIARLWSQIEEAVNNKNSSSFNSFQQDLVELL